MLSADNPLGKNRELWGKAPDGSGVIVELSVQSESVPNWATKRSEVSAHRTCQSDFKLSEQEESVKRVISLKQQSSIRCWGLSM